ncbi:MAG: TylF/MycF/NovP-related O-methyltransferase [Rhodopirellula sp. JB055]|uniref:TylF/MycF/NovP-related O-methyltransferase n=1 Tax=Rhodopirellula sp. JB055 TaxID=3342846 RepID=UPI003709CCD2
MPKNRLAKLKTAARIVRELYRDHDTIGKRLEALQRVAWELVPGYRLTWPDSDWCKDSDFNQYLESTGQLKGMNTHNRMMLAQLLRLSDNVPGDTVECGVYKGDSSWLICAANRSSPLSKQHHMFDSFEGISQPGSEDGQHWTRGDLSFGLNGVQERLKEFEQTAYYPGWIPDRFQDIQDLTFSFVHIDVDLHEPTKDSIEFFYERLNDGGILLCDDYGSAFCPGATKACDQFLSSKPESMISLPASGGFMIKGQQTGKNFWQTLA